MALDADLGIDSIKRVEILSALKEQLPEAPEFGPGSTGAVPDPGRYRGSFLGANLVAATDRSDLTDSTFPTTSTAADTGKIEAALLATIAEKTGYPAEMLELSMALDADLRNRFHQARRDSVGVEGATARSTRIRPRPIGAAPDAWAILSAFLGANLATVSDRVRSDGSTFGRRTAADTSQDRSRVCFRYHRRKDRLSRGYAGTFHGAGCRPRH